MHKNFKLIIGSLCLFLFTMGLQSCQQKSKPKQTTNVKPKPVNQEDSIVEMIMNLEEVKRKTAAVERGSKGKRTLSTYVETPPTSDDPNYWVKVAEDNGDSYVTYYTFLVDARTRNISYYDVVDGDFIPLAKWRQTTPLEDR